MESNAFSKSQNIPPTVNLFILSIDTLILIEDYVRLDLHCS